MKPEVDEFLTLLGTAIGGAPLPEGFSVGNGAALFALARRQDLGQVLAPLIKRYGLLLGDEALLDAFEEERLFAIRRTAILSYEGGRILSLLSAEGIDHVPLKGATLRALWPEPWMRTSCDIDILIREADMSRAVALLRERLGYTLRSVGYRDCSLYSPGDTAHLELHFSLRDTDARSRALANAWEYVERVGQASEYRLLPAFAIFYLLSHLAGHMEAGGGGIRPVIDLALLCRNPYDEACLASLLAGAGLSRFAEVVLSLGDAILSGAPVEGLCASLAEWLILGELYGDTVRRAAAYRIRAKDKGARQARRRYILLRLFPPRRELSLSFPALSRHAWLYPVALGLRWLRLLFGGRLSLALRRRRAAGRLSDAEALDTEALLFALSLYPGNKKTP